MPESTPALPSPSLTLVSEPFEYLTDAELARASGITLAFTGRAGGVSPAPFDRLNVSGQVGDDLANVAGNRRLLQEALGIKDVPLVIPHQIHGTDFLVIDEGDSCRDPASIVPETLDFDAVVVGRTNVAAMLCFADCVPVIIAAPSGRFAVVHAGWRGVYGSIAPKVVDYLAMTEDPSTFNVYIGPHIGAECFECGEDVHSDFVQKFGDVCRYDDRRIDLSAALFKDLTDAGVWGERICDCGICTTCNADRYFSYRAEDGYCGRQGAIACRRAVDANGGDR